MPHQSGALLDVLQATTQELLPSETLSDPCPPLSFNNLPVSPLTSLYLVVLFPMLGYNILSKLPKVCAA